MTEQAEVESAADRQFRLVSQAIEELRPFLRADGGDEDAGGGVVLGSYRVGYWLCQANCLWKFACAAGDLRKSALLARRKNEAHGAPRRRPRCQAVRDQAQVCSRNHSMCCPPDSVSARRD